MPSYSSLQPFSSGDDISDADWNAAVQQWKANQGQWDPVAGGGSDDPDMAEAPVGPDAILQLAQAQMPHGVWQALRARQLAAGEPDGPDSLSDGAGSETLAGGAGNDVIDPQKTEVFQRGPDGKLHPIPGWHTTGPFDFSTWAHDIDWGGVAKDLANTATDAGLFFDGVGAVAAVQRGTAWNVGRMTAEAARKQLRRRGAAVAGDEIHHSIVLNGTSRTVEDWRNHPAFLKVLPQAAHRRLTGSWGGLPRYGPVERFMVGTPNWMKSVPAWLAVHIPQALAAGQDGNDSDDEDIDGPYAPLLPR